MFEILRHSVCILLLSCSGFALEAVFFPPQVIEERLTSYTEKEKEAITRDLEVVRGVCLQGKEEFVRQQKPLYIATAGGPGSRKTTILERFLKESSFSGAYIDPDQRVLRFMVHTYLNRSLSAFVLREEKSYSQAVKKAYDKWRDASNYIALTLLEEVFANGWNVAHGTTSTASYLPEFFKSLQNRGYSITLLLCSCPDAFREKAIRYRNEEQKFYQASPEDALQKGSAYFENMATYFRYADTLYFYWSEDFETPEVLAAVFRNGYLEVRDAKGLEKWVERFEEERMALQQKGKVIPTWNELLQLAQSEF